MSGRSDMDRMAQSPQGRFVERFSQRGMNMNCAGDVLEHRAHLDRMDELAGEFGHMSADRLHAKDAMIVASRNDSYEPAFAPAFHRQRPAVR